MPLGSYQSKSYAENRNRFDRPVLSMASNRIFPEEESLCVQSLSRRVKGGGDGEKNIEFFVVRFAFKWPFVVRSFELDTN